MGPIVKLLDDGYTVDSRVAARSIRRTHGMDGRDSSESRQLNEEYLAQTITISPYTINTACQNSRYMDT